jgi:hypothetical protein
VAVITTHGEAVDPDEIFRAANAALRSAGHPELALLEVVTTDGGVPLGFTGKVLKSRLRQKYRSLEHYLAESDGKVLATSISPRDSRELLPT